MSTCNMHYQQKINHVWAIRGIWRPRRHTAVCSSWHGGTCCRSNPPWMTFCDAIQRIDCSSIPDVRWKWWKLFVQRNRPRHPPRSIFIQKIGSTCDHKQGKSSSPFPKPVYISSHFQNTNSVYWYCLLNIHGISIRYRPVNLVLEPILRESGHIAFHWLEISRTKASIIQYIEAQSNLTLNDTLEEFGVLPREADCEFKCPELDACIDGNLWCDGKH